MSNYTADWRPVGASSSSANVSFTARNDNEAIKKADRIARQLNVTKTPRTIVADGGVRTVQVIMSGVS